MHSQLLGHGMQRTVSCYQGPLPKFRDQCHIVSEIGGGGGGGVLAMSEMYYLRD